MIAALPMYDFPELREATDGLWAAIAARLGVSIGLTRGRDLQNIWTDPELLLSQTCGYPLVTSLAHRVTLVATPCYAAPGCDGPLYRSAIIVHAEDDATHLPDLRGRRCAINDLESNSGMNMLRAEIAPFSAGRRFFGEIVVTGAHVASVEAVAQGRADVAAIDCVTWAHVQRLRPEAARDVRVLAWTMATPGLPLVTSNRTDVSMRLALVRALDDVAQDWKLASVRDALLLAGFSVLPAEAYDSLLTLEPDPGIVAW